MATAASTFAAQLADDMRDSAPTCTAKRDTFGRLEACPNPGGSATSVCPSGHVQSGALCPEHSTDLYCWICLAAGIPDAPLTITTEVA